jgi:hypothetical protein
MTGGMVSHFARPDLFAINPDTLSVITAPKISPDVIGLGSSVLAVLHKRPHAEALAWRFKQSQSKWGA